MSGLAAVLAGHVGPGVYRWHGAFEALDVRHSVEAAGWAFAHVDGWTATTKPEILAELGRALGFPETYGQNLDALEDCLRSVGGADGGPPGVVVLWDGWSTLARADQRTFAIVLDIFGSRARATGKCPLAVLLRGDGPRIAGLVSLD